MHKSNETILLSILHIDVEDGGDNEGMPAAIAVEEAKRRKEGLDNEGPTKEQFNELQEQLKDVQNQLAKLIKNSASSSSSSTAAPPLIPPGLTSEGNHFGSLADEIFDEYQIPDRVRKEFSGLNKPRQVKLLCPGP